MVPKSVRIYGTCYESGSILILGKINHGTLKVGVVRCISVWNEDVNSLVSTYEACQSRYGFYVTTKSFSSYEDVDYSNLADYHPLKMIGSLAGFSFVLHHYISVGKL